METNSNKISESMITKGMRLKECRTKMVFLKLINQLL